MADEALRAALDDADRMLAPDGEYFVAADTDGEALLLRGSPADGYWYVVFDRAEGWRWAGSGTCSLATFRADDAYATWSLPVGEEPAPDATAVTVLVMERACTSGASVEGRMLPPEIDYGPTAVTITIGVVPLGASDGDPDAPPVSQTCQGVQTPVDVRLAEPLGDRKLLDGFWYPPQPPR